MPCDAVMSYSADVVAIASTSCRGAGCVWMSYPCMSHSEGRYIGWEGGRRSVCGCDTQMKNAQGLSGVPA